MTVINPSKDLRWTPDEGKAVAALSDKDHRKYRDEDEATHAAVLAATLGKKYLHFFCHGSCNWSNPLDSRLALAGSSLTLAEIMTKMDLSHTHLATLSACQTGITDIRQSPDEAVGLPAGFLQTGAPAVVSTLWPVDDQASGLLMQHFYRGLLNEEKPPAQALADAQSWMRTRSRVDAIKEFETENIEDESRRMVDKKLHGAPTIPDDHLYYWAGFIYSGS